MIRRRHVIFLSKLLIGLGLLAALLLIDDNWRKVVDLAGDIRVAVLIPFFGVTAVTIWISCVKWNLFLRRSKVRLSIGRLMKFYVIGIFFNNFFPSNFGGDAVRSYLVGKQIESQEQALATVFLERFTGFIAMVSMALGAALFSSALRHETLIQWSVLIMGALMVGVVVAIWNPKVITWTFAPFARFEVVQRLKEKASEFHGHVSLFREEPGLIARAMMYSFLFYIFAAIKVYFAGLLLGIHCSLPQLFVVTPIIMLIAAVPLTPNSLGIWEWGFSVYLVSAGATTGQGLAIALALRAQDIIVSLGGGVLFLLEPTFSDRAKASESL